MHIDGNTELIAHIGFPTASFKAPMIYNPSIERTFQRPLRALWPAAHVKR